MQQITDDSYLRHLVWLATHDADFLKRFRGFIDIAVLQPPELAFVMDCAIRYYEEYNSPMSGIVLRVLLQRRPANDGFDRDLAWEIFESARPVNESDRPAVYGQTEEWFQKMQLVEILEDAVELMEQGRLDEAIRHLAEQSQVVNPAGDDDEIGHLLLADCDEFAEKLFATLSENGGGIPTGIQEVDDAMGGGLRRGELGVFMAPPGVGKSQCLCFVARQAAKQGKVVFFYTLEMGTLRIEERIWSDLIDRQTHEFGQLNDQALLEILQEAACDDTLVAPGGDILIKRYPARKASAATLKSHMTQAERQRAMVPDLVVVDYADILAPDRHYAQRRDELAAIYEDLRALAVVKNVPIWTASQSNRISNGKSLIGMEHIADSWDKAKIADYIIALTRTDEDVAQDLANLVFVKVRNNAAPGPIKVVADFAHATFREY